MKKKYFFSSKDKKSWLDFTKNIGNISPKENSNFTNIIEKKNRLETKRDQEFMKHISNKNVYQNIEDEIKRII